MGHVHEVCYISGNLGAEIVNKSQIRKYFFDNYPYVSFSIAKITRVDNSSVNPFVKNDNKLNEVIGKTLSDIHFVDDFSENEEDVVSGMDFSSYLTLDNVKIFNEMFTQDISYSDLIAKILSYDIIFMQFPLDAFLLKNKTEIDLAKKDLNKLRSLLKKYPGKYFVLVTPIPPRFTKVDVELVKNARALIKHLYSKEFVGDSKNTSIFDLYNMLATADISSPKLDYLDENYKGNFVGNLNEFAVEKIFNELTAFIKFMTAGLDKIQLKIINK